VAFGKGFHLKHARKLAKRARGNQAWMQRVRNATRQGNRVQKMPYKGGYTHGMVPNPTQGLHLADAITEGGRRAFTKPRPIFNPGRPDFSEAARRRLPGGPF
jgi:hypothetical protein